MSAFGTYGVPTRLTAADAVTIESRLQEIGRGLLEVARAADPGVVSPQWWARQAGDRLTRDDDLEVRLFRLVDCMKLSALDGQFDAIDPAGSCDQVLSRLRPIWRQARRPPWSPATRST